jgi:hypothetical protein
MRRSIESELMFERRPPECADEAGAERGLDALGALRAEMEPAAAGRLTGGRVTTRVEVVRCAFVTRALWTTRGVWVPSK